MNNTASSKRASNEEVRRVRKPAMFIGEYTHSVDDKKRISLPSKFRKALGKQVIATHGLDQCLFLYHPDEWATIAEKLSGLGMGQAETRAFNRFILAGAVEIDID